MKWDGARESSKKKSVEKGRTGCGRGKEPAWESDPEKGEPGGHEKGPI